MAARKRRKPRPSSKSPSKTGARKGHATRVTPPAKTKPVDHLPPTPDHEDRTVIERLAGDDYERLMVEINRAIQIVVGAAGFEQLAVSSTPPFTKPLIRPAVSRTLTLGPPPEVKWTDSSSPGDGEPPEVVPLETLIPPEVLLLVWLTHKRLKDAHSQEKADWALNEMCKGLHPHKPLGVKSRINEGDLLVMRLMFLTGSSYADIAKAEFFKGKYAREQVREALRQHFDRHAD